MDREEFKKRIDRAVRWTKKLQEEQQPKPIPIKQFLIKEYQNGPSPKSNE